jgi:hypothetical protein
MAQGTATRNRRTTGGGSRSRARSSQAQSNGTMDKVKSAAKVVGPMAASAAAFTGGALLKQKLMPKRRKVLGMTLPTTPKLNGGKLDFKPVGKQLSKAGKRAASVSEQLAKLSGDVERAGRTAQKVGDSLS